MRSSYSDQWRFIVQVWRITVTWLLKTHTNVQKKCDDILPGIHFAPRSWPTKWLGRKRQVICPPLVIDPASPTIADVVVNDSKKCVPFHNVRTEKSETNNQWNRQRRGSECSLAFFWHKQNVIMHVTTFAVSSSWCVQVNLPFTKKLINCALISERSVMNVATHKVMKQHISLIALPFLLLA